MSKDVKQTKGLTRLHSLTPAEVSLVPTGANKRKFLILKSGALVGLAQRIREKVLKADPAVMAKVREIIQRHNEKGQDGVNAFGMQDGEDSKSGTPGVDQEQRQGMSPGSKDGVENEDAAEGVSKDELSAEGREHIAAHNFAIPEEKKYPIHDESHARNALARVAQHGSEEEKSKVRSAVHRKYPHIGAEEKEGVHKDGGQNDMDGYGEVGTGSGGGGLSKQAEAALQAVVRILSPFKEEIPSDLLNDVLEVGGFKAPANAMPGTTPAGDGKSAGEHFEPKEAEFQAIPAMVESEKEDFLEGVTKGHMSEAAEEAEKVYKSHLEKLGYQKYPLAKMCMKRGKGGEPVTKSGSDFAVIKDPHTRRALELVQKSNLELVKKNADLEKALADQRAGERKKEIVMKAASFKHIGIPQDDVVAQLVDADKIGAQSYERVVKTFATLDAQMKAGALYAELGSSRSGDSDSSSPDAKIAAMARGLVEKSADGSMTYEQAYEKVSMSPEGQRLYAEYKNARPHGI